MQLNLDLDTMSDDQIREVIRSLYAVLSTRQTIGAVVPPEGQPWRQPTGAHDAYQKDTTVTFAGETYKSTLDANVWSPSVYGWEKVVDTAPPPPTDIAAWAAGTSYQPGNKVTYQGVTYSAVQAHTSQAGWEPPNVPALWARV